MDEPVRRGLTPSSLGPDERALVSLLVGGHTLLEAARCLGVSPTRARMMLQRIELLSGSGGGSALTTLAAALGIDAVPPTQACHASRLGQT